MPHIGINAVNSFDRTERGVILNCQLSRYEVTETRQRGQSKQNIDRTAPINVTFLRPDIFRFELRANPETPDTGGKNADTTVLKTEVEPTVERSNGCLVISTEALTVQIGLDEWSFSVSDKTGQVLFETNQQRTNKKNKTEVRPLGFKENQTSEWLYSVDQSNIGFDIKPNEHYYGLGERFTDFDKRGQSVDVWVTQPHSTDNQRAYKNVPFYLSSRGYGIYVDTDDRVEFSFGSDSKSAVSGEISVHSDNLQFLFIKDTQLDRIVSHYTSVTGRPSVPPKWSFGLWASRYSYESREELEQVTNRLRAEKIPCDGVHLDISWMRDGYISDLKWDEIAFPDPVTMIQELHDNNFRIMLIEEPYLTAGSSAFDTAVEKGYLVNDDTGSPYILDRLVVSSYRGGIVDFTNKAAVDWWQAKHHDLLDMGVDGFWVDFGEYLPEDAILANGLSGRRMRNRYPDRYQQTVSNSMKSNGQDPILWSRAGWTGTQRFPVHWGGDSDSTFPSMAATLRGGLSLAVSGYGFWSHDIGGFNGTPSTELYIRWAQFGLLSSHARFHGKTPREPWEFGDKALEIFRKFARLRYQYLPYLYTWAVVTSKTGLPLMRPLVLHYSDDPAARTAETQYLLGRHMLIAPVIESGGRIEVYLPEGEWVEYWSDDWYQGSQTIEMDVPLDEVPIFFRAGSIIPTCKPSQSVERGPPEQLTLTARISNGHATGKYYNENTGKLVSISIDVNDKIRINIDEKLPDATIKIKKIRSNPEHITLCDEKNDERVITDSGSFSHQDNTVVIDHHQLG
jgi:alpha-D-xyloside xylohydrolase